MISTLLLSSTRHETRARARAQTAVHPQWCSIRRDVVRTSTSNREGGPSPLYSLPPQRLAGGGNRPTRFRERLHGISDATSWPGRLVPITPRVDESEVRIAVTRNGRRVQFAGDDLGALDIVEDPLHFRRAVARPKMAAVPRVFVEDVTRRKFATLERGQVRDGALGGGH